MLVGKIDGLPVLGKRIAEPVQEPARGIANLLRKASNEKYFPGHTVCPG